MAEVHHRYIGRIPSEGEQERQAKRDRLDSQWKQARIDAELARQKVHAAKLLEMKGELISKKHVTRQAAFLVLSLRARLLALSSDLSCKIAESCDADQRVIADLIDAGVRDALSEIAEMPLRVSDPRWIETLNDEATSSKPPRRATPQT